MKREDLKRIIAEELAKLRETTQFDSLEIAALDANGEEGVRLIWRREPAVEVVEQTLLAQLDNPSVARLMVHRGEDWVEANLPAIAGDERVDYLDYPEEEPRFSPEQEEQDARLENPDLYYGDEEE